METIEVQPLFDNYHRKIAKVNLKFKRYLYSQINWKARMIGIKGARGVGKTTMLLQHILDNYEDIDQTLYVSLDDLWFASHNLMELVDWADRHGLSRLYLDEVHRYKSWSETLKNIYDNYPDMGIVYTSSSLLAIDNAKVDLSRRQTPYTLYGLSFREFLDFEDVAHISPIPIETLLRDHVKQAMKITKNLKVTPLFEAYLKHGYYPFYREVGDDFPIICDANQGWDISTAIKFCKEVEDCNVLFFEQPLQSWDVDGMAEVRRSINIPLSADEGVATIQDARKLVEAHAVDIFSVKVSKNGGIAPAKEICKYADVNGIKVFFNSMIEEGITEAASLAIGVTTENIVEGIGHAYFSPLRLDGDICDYYKQIHPDLGITAITDKPGLGIELDKKQMEKYTVCTVTIAK